jgi:putative oxidoreductase
MSALNVPVASPVRQKTTSSQASGLVTFLGRLFFVLIFLLSGPRHFLSQTIAYAAKQGVPMAQIAVPFSGLLAVIGGLSVLLGYRAKSAPG